MNPESDITPQVVVFGLDKEEYAVPILEVQEIVKFPEITPVPDSPPYIAGVINLRGKVVPILDLEKRFELHRETPTKPGYVIVFTSTTSDLLGMQVDVVTEVLRITENDVKPAPTMVSSTVAGEYLSGVIVKGERIILVINLQRISAPDKLTS